jgi:hypothetical protein
MQIESDRLKVEIAEPGSAYRGARFDWSSFITSVTLDSAHQYCAAEQKVPNGHRGMGFCSEFGIFGPVGFSSTEPGQCFPKFGVGLLKRPDKKKYQFNRPYEFTPFPFSFHARSDCVTFQTEAVCCLGYALTQSRKISVADNRLTVLNTLANIGQEAVVTHEYAHNFVALKQWPAERRCRLRTSFPLTKTEQSHGLAMRGDEVVWQNIDGESSYVRFGATSNGSPPPLDYWELTDLTTGRGLRETTDFAWAKFAIHSYRDTISPEAFIDLHLRPGETISWQRQYEFF